MSADYLRDIPSHESSPLRRDPTICTGFAAGELNEEAFARARMDERILLLRSRLPDFLVEHRGMYGILSVGVHELTEGQCLLYFDVVRKGIEAILEQYIEAERKADRLKEASNAVLKLQEELNRPKS